MIANPGQLGLQSLSVHLATTISERTPWLPGFNLSNVYYFSQAATIGASMSDFIDCPVDVSLGVGYSKVTLNLGDFAATGPDPTQIQTFAGYEQSEAFTVGIGIEFGVQLGIGFTTKHIESQLGATIVDYTSPPRPIVATPHTTDYGAILRVPLASLVEHSLGRPEEGLHPIVDMNLSYVRSNVGGSVSYIDVSQSDPLPRLASLGASADIGISFRSGQREYRLVSFTIAREAYDLLIARNVTGTFTYKDGLGNLSFLRNVIQSEGSNVVYLRRGFQVNVLDAVYIQAGSFDGPGSHYWTNGYGVRLSGVLKAIVLSQGSAVQSGTLDFLVRHLDVQYSRSWYSGVAGSPLEGTTFGGLTLVLR
jgi:hypothetical protein